MHYIITFNFFLITLFEFFVIIYYVLKIRTMRFKSLLKYTAFANLYVTSATVPINMIVLADFYILLVQIAALVLSLYVTETIESD